MQTARAPCLRPPRHGTCRRPAASPVGVWRVVGVQLKSAAAAAGQERLLKNTYIKVCYAQSCTQAPSVVNSSMPISMR